MSDFNQETNPEKASERLPAWWLCVFVAFISRGSATAAYALTAAIAQTYAEKPIDTTNATATSIGSAVRTLVVGVAGLATFVFAFATLGLLALALQRIVQQRQQSSS
jgi:hypothetical protein